MKVLAISGWKKSGKDTLTDYLVDKYDANRISFAGPLKDKVSTDFNIPRNHLDDQEFKEKPILTLPVDPQDKFSLNVVRFMFKEFRCMNGEIASHFVEEKNMGLFENELRILYQTPRSLATIEGSTKRSIDSAYWVKQAIQYINTLKRDQERTYNSTPYLPVITDMRFKSEALQLKKIFGDKLVTIRVNRFDTSPSQDPSEIDMDDYAFDHVIENRGTLQEFYNKIDELMDKLK